MPDVKMNDLLAEMASGISGTWQIVIADNDGMLLSFWEAPENKVPPEMMGGFINTINMTIDAFKQSAAGFGKIDDVIFSMGFSTIVIKPMADGACFMVINAPKTVPLGMIRMAANNYAPKLEQSLPGHEPLPRRDGMGTIVP
jgi:predicted regulator of Ras-like GTPase activity (Roadblock/LC7/MglB family)